MLFRVKKTPPAPKMVFDITGLKIQQTLRGVVIGLRVAPGASKEEIGGVYDGTLKIRVTAPPEKGKANHAVVKLLAKKLDVPERNVCITGGETSQNKTVEIADISADRLIEKLTE